MPLVTISARHIEMPDICVCCGGPTSVSLTSRETRIYDTERFRFTGQANDFRACVQCVGHQQSIKHSALPYLLAVALSGLLSPWAILCTGLIAVVAHSVVHRHVTARIRSQRLPACEVVECMAAHKKSHGTEHTFRFDSRRFALAFAAANEAEKKKVWVDLNAFVPSTNQLPRGSVLLSLIVFLGIVVLVSLASTRDSAGRASRAVSVADQGAPITFATSQGPQTQTPAVHRHQASHSQHHRVHDGTSTDSGLSTEIVQPVIAGKIVAKP